MEIDYTEHKNKNEKNDFHFEQIIERLKNYFSKNILPSVSQIKEEGADTFQILISTIISARTKDEVTYKASKRLFSLAKNPEEMKLLSIEQIANAIYPAGFYNNKAKNIKKTCEILVEKYNGSIPDNLEELIKLPGVGRKTANLVLSVGLKKDGLCVDTHVHRISNRLGVLKTIKPFDTEMELRKILPKKYWEVYNELLVLLGQNICKARKPICEECPIEKFCKKAYI